MDFLFKSCFLYIIFLNLFTHNRAQDILGEILGGIQNGINLVNNNLDIGQTDYPDYGPPANTVLSFSRSNDVSQSNQNPQNDPDEPYNSNSEQRQEGGSSLNSEENDRGNPNFIDNKERTPVKNQNMNNIQQNISPNRHSGPFNGKIQSKLIIRKPALLNNQKPGTLSKEKLGSTHNKDSLNSHNLTTIIKDGSTTSTPLVFVVNKTMIDNIPNLSVTNDSLINHNLSNSTNPLKTAEKDKTIEKDNKYVLKPLTKRKFFFQAKPVIPLNVEESTNETIYYIDLDI